MLFPATVQVLETFYRFVHSIGASPFEVQVRVSAIGSSKARASSIRLTRPTSARKLWAWYASVAFSVAYTLFIVVRILQGIYVLNTPPEHLIFSTFGAICWCTVTVFNVNNLRLGDDVALFINQFFELNRKQRQIHQIGDAAVSSDANTRKIILALLAMSALFCVEMVFVILVMGYDVPVFPSSVFEYTRLSRWHLLPWAVFQALNTCLGAGVILFYTLSFYSYIFVLSGALAQAASRSSSSRGRPADLSLHRQLHLLTCAYGTALKNLVLPVFTAALMAISVTCNYASLKMVHAFGFPAYLILPLMSSISLGAALILFPACFRVRQRSEAILKTWVQSQARTQAKLPRDKRQMAIQVRALKSCQPIGVRVASLYIIQPIEVIAYMDRMMTYTINLLIAF